MNTHTIRNSKDKTARIVTFRAVFFKKLLESHPRASLLLVAELLKFCKDNTGKRHVVEHTQQEALLSLVARVNTLPIADYNNHLINSWVTSGFRIMDADLVVLLGALDQFYNTLNPQPTP